MISVFENKAVKIATLGRLMRFEALTLADIPAFRRYFTLARMKTCDYSVGGMFMWRDYFRMEYAVENDILISRLKNENGEIYYNLPLAADMRAATSYVISTLAENGRISFCTVPQDKLSLFDTLGDAVTVTEQASYADYVYAPTDLITLAGKKFAGQRNQISQFKRGVTHWEFLPLSAENLPAVRAYYGRTHAYAPAPNDSRSAESNMVFEVLDRMEDYQMLGGVLYADGDIVGFSLGEKIGDILYTHIEKADRTCKGAYQMLVQQFSAMYGADVSLINREEDMGDPGLRAAKLSYHPQMQLKKYIVDIQMP